MPTNPKREDTPAWKQAILDHEAGKQQRETERITKRARDNMTPPKPKAAHTPGPWYINDEENDERWMCIYAMVGDKFVVVCDNVWGYHPTDRTERTANGEANARLIAAAPKMLELLLVLRDLADSPDHQKKGDVEECFKWEKLRSLLTDLEAQNV